MFFPKTVNLLQQEHPSKEVGDTIWLTAVQLLLDKYKKRKIQIEPQK